MDLNSQIDPQSELGCSIRKQKAVQAAINQGLLTEDEPIAMFYDLERFKKGMDEIKQAMPSFFVHTMAIKSNPVIGLMKIAKERGLGFEAASLGELSQALKVCEDDSQRIVFDSPVKTKKELRLSLEKGVVLNLDNFDELTTVKELIQKENYKNINVGLRVNPQVGVGTIKEMSTGGLISKFGIPFTELTEQIYDAYDKNTWLNGLHIHVGSQGIPLDLMFAGVRKIVDIALEVNKRRGSQQITFIDIGGGLPVNFDSEEDNTSSAPSVQEYVRLLKEKCPELFSGAFKVYTEFGRRYNAKPGFIVSRVEYTKSSGGRKFATIHVGADMFVRTVWAPTKWAIRVSVLDSKGNLKQDNNKHPYDIAGPCCFSGDVIAHERVLPEIQRGDFIVAHDTGGYYYSSYCYYNLRTAPAIYGFDSDPQVFSIIKEAKSVEETIHFFN